MNKIYNKRILQFGLKYLREGDHGHGHGARMLPFARQAPPTSQIPNQVELVWDDTVAPETAIDFDVPYVSIKQALISVGLMFGFVGCIYGFAVYMNPEESSIVAKRKSVIPSREECDQVEDIDDHHLDEHDENNILN